MSKAPCAHDSVATAAAKMLLMLMLLMMIGQTWQSVLCTVLHHAAPLRFKRSTYLHGLAKPLPALATVHTSLQ